MLVAFVLGRVRLRESAAAVLLLMIVAAAQGQTPPGSTSTPPATATPADVLREQLTAAQQQLDAATDLTEEVRSNVDKLLQQARTSLKAADDSQIRAAQLAEQIRQVSAEAKRLETELANERDIVDLRPAVDQPLDAQLMQAQQVLAELNVQKSQLLDPQERTVHRKALREQLIALPQQLAEATAKIGASPPDGESPLVSQAAQLQWQARKLALEQQQASVRHEIDLLDAEDPPEIPRLRRELLDFKINRQRRFLASLDEQVARMRRAIAEDRVEQARAALAGLSAEDRPLLEPMLEQSLEYAQAIVRTRQEVQRYQARRDTALEQLAEVRKQYEQAVDREKKVGLTPALGLRLRQQRQNLEDARDIRRRVHLRLETIEAAQLDFLDQSDQLETLSDVEPHVDALLDPLPPDERGRFEQPLRRELERQRENLAQLVQTSSEYTLTLDELDTAELQLIQEINRFTTFIDEHILWIRSDRPLSWSSLAGDRPTLVWLLSGRFPRDLTSALGQDVRRHFLWWTAAVLLWLVLLLRGPVLRRRLRDLARAAENRVQTDMTPTLHAWWITAMIAATWPGALLFAAWRLVESEAATAEVTNFGRSLAMIGVAFLFLEFYRQVWRKGGLADAHFEWPDRALQLLRRTMQQLVLFGLPVAILAAVLNARERGAGSSETGSLAMLAFIAGLLVVAACAHRLLKPSTGVLREATAYAAGGWVDRLSGLFWLAGIGVPILLIVLTAIGNYYTAQQLLEKVEITVWLLLSVLFVRAILYRWLMLKHRRLRIEQLRQRRAAAAEEAAAAGDAAASEVPEVAADPQADLHAINQQTQRLVSTSLLAATAVGLWFTWVDVLPALNYLDRWVLWETTETVQEMVTSPDGQQTVQVRPDVVQITVVHLFWCMLLVAFTFTAARNVPGLLEIAILQRLPLDASVRYAVTALTRYAIVLLGLVLATQALGVGWSQVQWLAAALTFGLGFGLQEIFANFISGIIILFEQPVRVGDLVTIGDVSGRVSRIRIRATTITDFDRKDYIVPNKEFITGRLLNWTLTDTMNRVVINVGVAYGVDTDRVRSILSRVVQEHPLVLKDPAPLVFFDRFGDSALNFQVMVFLPNFDNRVQAIHELHTAVHRVLGDAGIEIPFPQRDLHVRTMPAGIQGISSNGAGNGQYGAAGTREPGVEADPGEK